MNSRKTTLFAAFAASKVDYLVVGGVAVNAYGFRRGTHDLDVLIRPNMENAQLAFDALVAIGIPLDGMDPTDLLTDYDNIRYGPAEDHVDILSGIQGVAFDDAWRNRHELIIGDVLVPFISKEDLIKSKLTTGRLRDLVDVEELRLRRNLEPEQRHLEDL